jgi:hypothetical protein
MSALILILYTKPYVMEGLRMLLEIEEWMVETINIEEVDPLPGLYTRDPALIIFDTWYNPARKYCFAIRQDAQLQSIPVLVISGFIHAEAEVQALGGHWILPEYDIDAFYALVRQLVKAANG